MLSSVENVVEVIHDTMFVYQLMQEMFHDRGYRFTSLTSVKDKVRALTKSWNTSFAPAIINLEEESGNPGPESEHINGK